MPKKGVVRAILGRNEENAPEFVEAEDITIKSSNEVELTMGNNDEVSTIEVDHLDENGNVTGTTIFMPQS